MSINTPYITIKSVDDVKRILKNGEVVDITTLFLLQNWIFTNEFRMHFFHPTTFSYFKYSDFTFEDFFDSYYDQQHARVESYYRLKKAMETGKNNDDSTFDDNVFSDYEDLFDGQDGDMIVSICDDGGIPPPFVYEHYFDQDFMGDEYFTEGKEYKVAPPFFFDLAGELFYMAEKRVDQSSGKISPVIYRLSSISFPEFVSALLWKIFSTKPSKIFSPEYSKINSWDSAFLEYFLNPRFFDVLCFLNATFSAEELSRFQGTLSIEIRFFQSGGFLDKYKGSVGASNFSRTLSKLLTVIGFDPEKAVELAREYTCTEDPTKLSRALRAGSASSVSPKSVSLVSPESVSLVSPESVSLVSPKSVSLVSPESVSLVSPESVPLVSPESVPLVPQSSMPLKRAFQGIWLFLNRFRREFATRLKG